jgi:hypothetical protein
MTNLRKRYDTDCVLDLGGIGCPRTIITCRALGHCSMPILTDIEVLTRTRESIASLRSALESTPRCADANPAHSGRPTPLEMYAETTWLHKLLQVALSWRQGDSDIPPMTMEEKWLPCLSNLCCWWSTMTQRN